jgi:ABC-2 type transport system permease protein
MSTRRMIELISRREFHDRVRNRAFIIGTAITVAIIVAAIVVPTLLRGDGPQEVHVGLVGEVPAGFAEAVEPLAAANELSVELVELADGRGGQAGEADAYRVQAPRALSPPSWPGAHP